MGLITTPWWRWILRWITHVRAPEIKKYDARTGSYKTLEPMWNPRPWAMRWLRSEWMLAPRRNDR